MELRDFTSPDIIESEAIRIGILPFFNNRVEGFSIAEHTPENLWFNDNVDGPWEWKGPIIANMRCAYGKFFEQKAGYISLELLPHLINIRRSLYPLDKMTNVERCVYDTLVSHESMRSDHLKDKTGLWPKTRAKKADDNIIDIIAAKGAKGNNKSKESKVESFDTAIMKLQMSTWIVTGDFEYLYTKEGKRYGWGKAVYVSPEAMYGESITNTDGISPEESMEIICNHIKENTGIEKSVVMKMMTWKI